jgi:hypothetical protein
MGSPYHAYQRLARRLGIASTDPDAIDAALEAWRKGK